MKKCAERELLSNAVQFYFKGLAELMLHYVKSSLESLDIKVSIFKELPFKHLNFNNLLSTNLLSKH